jgi:hypothetical protein
MKNKLYRDLSNFELKSDSIQKIENNLSEAILGHTRTTMNISPDGLFRARVINNINETELNTPSSIWYPDWKTIRKEDHRLGRLSDKGKNFFYSSNYLGATIKELSPKDGDRILVGIFYQKFPGTKIYSQFAGIESIRKTKIFSLLDDFSYASEKNKIIEEFFSNKFQEKVETSEDYKYKLTIALSNILLKNPEIGCLIYPSVASNLHSVNFGIKPEIVDEHFYCRGMFTYIVKRDSKGYTLVPDKFSKKIIANGTEAKEFDVKWQINNAKEKRIIKRYSL